MEPATDDVLARFERHCALGLPVPPEDAAAVLARFRAVEEWCERLREVVAQQITDEAQAMGLYDASDG